MNSLRYQSNFLRAVLALAIFSLPAWASELPQLRSVDKVELLSIDYEKGYIKRIIETKLIEGKEAASVVTTWKKQKLLGQSPSACHQPAYAMKFYSKEKLVMFATICWACRNIDFVMPKQKHWVKFEADSKNGQMLKSLFIKAFPSIKNVISCVTEQAPAYCPYAR